MQPMPLIRRRIYFALLALVFLFAVPALVLYSEGYRVGENFNLVQTGGIYVSADRVGSEVILDDEVVDATTFFRRGFLLQTLPPGDYTIRVRKDEYQEWTKDIKVFPQVVSEANAFLLPQKPILVPIRPELLLDGGDGEIATTTNPLYGNALSLFATSTATSSPTRAMSATSTPPRQGLTLLEEGDAIFVKWTGRIDSIPLYFCDRKMTCRDRIKIHAGGSRIHHHAFYPGRDSLVVYETDAGIFVSEIDDRGGQNVQILYEEPGAQFRILEGSRLFLRDGDDYFEVEL